MSLISLNQIGFSVGGPLLLDHIDFSIETQERIALIGRNGAGKSTLLGIIAGDIKPDDGEVRVAEGVRIARLAQEVPRDASGDVFEVVSRGLGDLGKWLSEYHHLSHAEHFDADAMSDVQAKIEAVHGWSADQRVVETLAKLELDGDAQFAELSGGMKRRVLLAQALVSAPDVLLLDEPTNHLDLEAIDWLENFLLSWRGSVVFVTHDRRFLRSLATRIVEIDRGALTSWPGDWQNYQRRKEERLHAEAQEQARFDKMLAQEEIWIRQGIKARRVRDEGRVKRLKEMRNERAARRDHVGQVKLEVTQSEQSGRKVIEAKSLQFAFGERVMVRDFSSTIWRGDRIGLIGPNGSGKTTLIKLLLEQLQPDAGEIRTGTKLQVAYFDQYRAQLREDWDALHNVSDGSDFIEINGRSKHVLSYLQDFLFTPERARAPITKLSGGERNRLLLAKLFAQPANLIVMDEPTNDLDVETLELLEELLGDFDGTLLLVSHDREFLDQVVTSTLVMEGEGTIGEYVGGYSDWVRQRTLANREASPQATNKLVPTESNQPSREEKTSNEVSVAKTARRKMSFNEVRELELLPAKIEQLESQIAAMTLKMNEPSFFQQESEKINQHNAKLAAIQVELETTFARWETLEAQANQVSA